MSDVKFKLKEVLHKTKTQGHQLSKLVVEIFIGIKIKTMNSTKMQGSKISITIKVLLKVKFRKQAEVAEAEIQSNTEKEVSK